MERLPIEQQAKALALLRLLEERGISLAFPYTSQVRGRIRELRTQYGKNKIRILYFADTRRRMILLHGFVKRGDRLSSGDIQIAEERMRRHEERLKGGE